MKVARALFADMMRAVRAYGPPAQADIETKPVPASRPRISKWGTYYAKTYRDWRDEARRLLKGVRAGVSPATGPIVVFTEIVSPRPKTTKRTFPRGDNDNFEKGIWDAITSDGRWWNDDDQIILNITLKRYAEGHETPGTYLHIFELEADE